MGVIDIPVFTGIDFDLQPWISWSDEFFVRKDFSELEKLNFAQSFMEGEARIWFQQRQSLFLFHSWDEVKDALLLRFGKAYAAESIKMRDESKPQIRPNPSIPRDHVHIVNSELDRNDNRIGTHMPIFEGVSPYGWISRVERFFRIGQVSEAEKLNKVSLSMVGDALTWYKEELARDEFRDWSELKRRLVARFAQVRRCLPPQVMLKKKSIPKIDQEEESGKETELMQKKDPKMKTDSWEMIDSTMDHELQEASVSNLAPYGVLPLKIGSLTSKELHEASWVCLNESSLVVDELSSGLGMDVLVVHQKEQPVLLVTEMDELAQKSTGVSGIKKAHHLLVKSHLKVTSKNMQRKCFKSRRFKFKNKAKSREWKESILAIEQKAESRCDIESIASLGITVSTEEHVLHEATFSNVAIDDVPQLPAKISTTCEEMESTESILVEVTNSNLATDGVPKPQNKGSQSQVGIIFEVVLIDLGVAVWMLQKMERLHVLDVSEVDECSEKSTCVNSTVIASHVLDKMLLKGKKLQHTRRLKKCSKTWKFKFKIRSWTRCLVHNKLWFSETIEDDVNIKDIVEELAISEILEKQFYFMGRQVDLEWGEHISELIVALSWESVWPLLDVRPLKKKQSREHIHILTESCMIQREWFMKHETKGTDYHLQHCWKKKAAKCHIVSDLLGLGLVSFHDNLVNWILHPITKGDPLLLVGTYIRCGLSWSNTIGYRKMCADNSTITCINFVVISQQYRRFKHYNIEEVAWQDIKGLIKEQLLQAGLIREIINFWGTLEIHVRLQWKQSKFPKSRKFKYKDLGFEYKDVPNRKPAISAPLWRVIFSVWHRWKNKALQHIGIRQRLHPFIFHQ